MVLYYIVILILVMFLLCNKDIQKSAYARLKLIKFQYLITQLCLFATSLYNCSICSLNFSSIFFRINFILGVAH